MKNTVLVTGATKGVGNIIIRMLAKKGWRVILQGRNRYVLEEKLSILKEITDNKDIHYVIGDLFDLRDVKRMAEEVRERFPELNCLILNATTFSNNRRLTAEGQERTWVVNYLSRFLLTMELLPTLKANKPSRIIDMSGKGHRKGQINFDDPSLEGNYSLARASEQAKLANVLFTYALARRLEGSGVTINTVEPGAVNTESVLLSDEFSGFEKFMYRLMKRFYTEPQDAARTPVFLATSPKVEGVNGKYYAKRKQKKSSDQSYDEQLQRKLWEWTYEWLVEYDYIERGTRNGE